MELKFLETLVAALLLVLVLLIGSLTWDGRIKRREAERAAEVRRQAQQKMQAFRQSGSERTQMMDLADVWRPSK